MSDDKDQCQLSFHTTLEISGQRLKACSNQHFTILIVETRAVNSVQVVLCIVVVYMQSMESLLSMDVNVALYAVSVILHQPSACHVWRGENFRRVRDKNEK